MTARPAARANGAASNGNRDLATRLAGQTEAEQLHTLLATVRTEASHVLGHTDGEAVEVDRSFKDAGFDSLTAVELRNRLTNTTGLRLPATPDLRLPHPGRARRATCARCWPAGRPRRRRVRSAAARAATSRWRSSRWHAGSRAG